MYEPRPLIFPPNFKRDKELQQLATYIAAELDSVSRSQHEAVEGVLFTVLHSEPKRPRAGLVVYADGSDWNPGSGEGQYRFNLAGSWVFIG